MAKFSPVKTLIGKMTPIDSSESLIGRMDSISSSESLIGKINPTESISGKVEKPSDMSGEININPEKDIPTYDGNYIVIPKAYKEQILETKEKMMEDNVVVKKIPYYETSNVDGGETVYIAGEVTYG